MLGPAQGSGYAGCRVREREQGRYTLKLQLPLQTALLPVKSLTRPVRPLSLPLSHPCCFVPLAFSTASIILFYVFLSPLAAETGLRLPISVLLGSDVP